MRETFNLSIITLPCTYMKKKFNERKNNYIWKLTTNESENNFSFPVLGSPENHCCNFNLQNRKFVACVIRIGLYFNYFNFRSQQNWINCWFSILKICFVRFLANIVELLLPGLQIFGLYISGSLVLSRPSKNLVLSVANLFIFNFFFDLN